MRKPLLFITGFLGAGKTTLLRALLEESSRMGRTADVILNDFENADIDAATLPASDASIFPLAASCACCDSLDDLVKLCLAAQTSGGDALFIELNGTADPLPLLETFTLLEHKMPFAPRWQVGIVDARHWGQRGGYGPLEIRQIETATHWVLTHEESLTAGERDAVIQSVEAANRYAVRVDAVRLAADLASGAGHDLRQDIEAKGDATHDHEHALSHRFTGCQFPLPGRYRHQQIVRFLDSLPDEVVRAKALVKLSEAPGAYWLFERTGRHPIEAPIQVGGLVNSSPSLVCIGPGLEPKELREMVASHFGV